MVSGNGLVTGLDRLLEHPGRGAHRRHVPERGGRHRARPAGRPDQRGAEPAGAPGPDGAAQADVRQAPVRGADAGAGAGRGGRGRRRCARCTPSGSTRPARRWCIVGDLSPERALDAAERALSGWDGDGSRRRAAADAAARAGPLLLVDRPGSVQSSLRMALPAVPRTHPDHAALQLANLVFGGYFSSRWVENIREDKGYTYGPHSLDRALGGRLDAGRRRRGRDRGDRPGAVGDVVRAGPAGLAAADGRGAGAGPAVRAGHAAAGHVHAGRAGRVGLAYAGSGCGWSSSPSTRPGWRRRPGSEVAAAATEYLAPAGRSPWCSATRSGSSAPLAALASVRTEAGGS